MNGLTSGILSKISQIGPILLGGVVLLPVAGVLIVIGKFSPAVLHLSMLMDIGGIIFDNLPLLFAVVVAAGFSVDKQGGLAGLVCFMVDKCRFGYNSSYGKFWRCLYTCHGH